MCHQRRHGTHEPCLHDLVRVQSDHARLGHPNLRGVAGWLELSAAGTKTTFACMGCQKDYAILTSPSQPIPNNTITWTKRKTRSPRDPSCHHQSNLSPGRSLPTRSSGRCVCSSRTSDDPRLSTNSGRGRSLLSRRQGSRCRRVGSSIARRSRGRFRFRYQEDRARSRRHSGSGGLALLLWVRRRKGTGRRCSQRTC